MPQPPNPDQTRPLRVGIIGGGRMAANHIRAAVATGGRASVVALADPSESARSSIVEQFPGTRTYAGIEELLEAEPLDVAHVVTPAGTHGALARFTVSRGLHTYVEKPFTETVAEGRDILDEAAVRGVRVCAGHQLLFAPPTRVVERLLPALAKMVHVESYFSFRTVRHMAGGGAPLRPDLQLLDVLPHPVYLLLRVLERAGTGTTDLASLEVHREGTIHALLRRGTVTGMLVVTLEGRPVESYLRITGTNGSVLADYVRNTVQRSLGPGTSGIDKLIAPYRQSMQLLFGSTAAFGARFLRRGWSYPGLPELLAAFYDSVRSGGEPPISPESILDTVRISEEVARALGSRVSERSAAPPGLSMAGRGVLVTGGTGFLGRAVVQALLDRGQRARVAARREPPPWERMPDVDYVVADLASGLTPSNLEGIETVIHCAAETAGGWEEHQRNSLDATERTMRAAADVGVRRFIQVSSLAVLARSSGGPIGDDHPLEPDSRGSGPYVWGKLESERLAVRLAGELGIEVKVVRPGALVDYDTFDPPGRLGKRLGNLFVAVGRPGHRLGTTDVRFAGHALAWMTDHWAEAPGVINLLDPEQPTKRDLLRRLKAANPDLRVVWLPTVLLVPLSWAAIVLQKLLRPRRPAINAAKVFAVQRYDPARSRALGQRLEEERPTHPR